VDFGIIKSITIGVNLDSGEDVRLAQVNMVGEDTVTVEMPFPEGDEFCPAVGDTVYYEEVDDGLLVARCIQSALPVDSSLGDGEREMFSRSGSGRAAKMRLRNDGEMVLNEGDDYAVKFEKLEAALTALQDAQNTLWDTVFTHTHPYLNGSTASKTSASGELAGKTAPTLDMADAKVEKVRL
jgi:hypothetical protein